MLCAQERKQNVYNVKYLHWCVISLCIWVACNGKPYSKHWPNWIVTNLAKPTLLALIISVTGEGFGI